MKTQAKTFGFTIMAMGLVFTVCGLLAERNVQMLRAHGKAEKGEITGAKVSTGSKNKKSYALTAVWGEGAARHTDTFVVKNKYYFSKIQGEQIIDPTITILHIPGEEGSAYIEGGTSDLSGMQYLGYVVALLGLYLTYKAFRKRPLPPEQITPVV